MTKIFEHYRDKAKQILADNWTGSYTKPSPALYPHQWNWDSGFIAIGKSHYDIDEAVTEVESLFRAQWANGMVPQIVFNPDALGHYFPEPDFWQTERSPDSPEGFLTSGITMPPVHAIAVEHIHRHAREKKQILPFLEKIYPKLLASHQYLYRERDPGNEGLVYIRHPWESGVDNSPTWDVPLKAININRLTFPHYTRRDTEHIDPLMRPSDDDYDRYVYLVDLFRINEYDETLIRDQCPFLIQDPMFNAILCRADESLIRIAGILGEPTEQPEMWMERTREAIRTKLWCSEKQNFNAIDMLTRRFIYVDTSAGFLPLYAGAATREQAGILYSRLDSISFCSLHQGNCYTIPNYDTQQEGFDRANYWRGPVWININWMLAQGLRRYGYTLKADSLQKDLLQLPIRFGFHEYFDSFSGTGYGSADFSWTAALFIDLVDEFYRKEERTRDLKYNLTSVFTPSRVLNDGESLPSCSMEDLPAELMKIVRDMRDSHYDTERGLVDYSALKESEQFREYRTHTNGLRQFVSDRLKNQAEKLAFWINLYNSLVVDGILTLGVKSTVLEVPGFFRKIRYSIAGHTFSLNDIEHGILRRNSHPYRFPFPPFLLRPRMRRWMVDQLDPRIHFALVCGSRSCAPIDYYDPDKINEQLDQAAASFINSSEVLVFPEESKVLLSEIFLWYEKDFGGKWGVIDFICRHTANTDAREYLQKHPPDLELEYLFYDWDLNRWGK